MAGHLTNHSSMVTRVTIVLLQGLRGSALLVGPLLGTALLVFVGPHLHGRSGRWNDCLSLHTLSQMVIAYSEQIFNDQLSLSESFCFASQDHVSFENSIFCFDSLLLLDQSKDSSSGLHRQ